ncbi:SpoIIE family protein phosphatase [Candidatus Omnitrophota bacterium]
MNKKHSIAFKLSFSILASSTVIFTIAFGYNYMFSRRIITENIEARADNLAHLVVNKIESILRPVEKVPESLAHSLERSTYSKEKLLELLRAVVEDNDEIYGATIAFKPHSYDKASLYFAPYYYKDDGEVKFTYLGSDTYRYFYWDWYQIPKMLGRAVWSEPYYDEGGGNIIMSTYSVPFYIEKDGKKEFMGIVTADISLTWLQKIVSSIKIGKTGYGFLISKNGTMVTHPAKELIMNATIFSIAEEKRDPSLRRLGRKMIKGEAGFTHFTSILTGKKCWLVYVPVPSTAWSLAVLFPQKELMADVTKLNITVLVLGSIGFLFLLTVIVVIAGTITKPLRILARTTKDIAKGNLDFELPPIKSGDEVGELADSFLYMRGSLKRYIKELTETTKAKERIQSELKIAHDIQMGIVPKKFPPFPQNTEFDLYAILYPAKEVGGDFYDFFFVDDVNLCFVIGDVSGKGVPAALFMAIVKTLIKATAKITQNPDEILDRVNKEMGRENESCMFATVFCGFLNIKTGRVLFTNGGHNPPLLIKKGTHPGFMPDPNSAAVGIDEKAVFKKSELVLEPGDEIYMYTDGVTEAFNDKQEMFGDKRLQHEVSSLAGEATTELVKKTLQAVKAFTGSAPQSDDITIFVLQYNGNDKE